MFTSLDLLVIVFMALAAATLLTVCLMFLIKNKIVRRVCFYVASALGVYMGYVGIRIGLGMFPIQVLIGAVAAIACIGAVIFEIIKRGNEKSFLIARITSAASLVIGLLNAML